MGGGEGERSGGRGVGLTLIGALVIIFQMGDHCINHHTLRICHHLMQLNKLYEA